VNYDGYDIKIIDFIVMHRTLAIKLQSRSMVTNLLIQIRILPEQRLIASLSVVKFRLSLANPSFKVSTTDSTGTLFATSSPIVTQKSSISAGVPLGNGVAAQKLTIQGIETKAVYIDANDSAKEIADKVNAESASTGVTATASTTVSLRALSGILTLVKNFFHSPVKGALRSRMLFPPEGRL